MELINIEKCEIVAKLHNKKMLFSTIILQSK